MHILHLFDIVCMVEEGAALAVLDRINIHSSESCHWCFHLLLHYLSSGKHLHIHWQLKTEVVSLNMSLMLSTEHAPRFLLIWAVNDDFTVSVLLQPDTGHATGGPSTICSLKWDISSVSLWNSCSHRETAHFKSIATAVVVTAGAGTLWTDRNEH